MSCVKLPRAPALAHARTAVNFELELERIGLGILCSVFVSLSIPLLNPYLCTYTYTVFSLYMLSRKGNAHEP